MKIVFLDTKTIGDDIDLTEFDRLGEVIRYPFTAPDEVAERVHDADIIIINKVAVNKQTLGDAPNLKLVCVTATGTDNLDKDFLSERRIHWRNVAGYSTDSVAQHTFSLLFYLLEKSRYYDDYVKAGHYVNDTVFTHFSEHFHELSHMTWGIIGLGAIGRRVADIATVFGSNVIYYSSSGRPSQDVYTQVDFDTLLTTSDIISIHAPLNQYTEGLLNEVAFDKMKPSAILLNLGRGAIINETDLVNALNNGKISAAGLDVLNVEPMSATNPLLNIKDSRKLYITPHIAWSSVEARTRLMKIIQNQIIDFINNPH